MNETPLFSLLIANYNNGHFIQQAIESVLNQTYKNWEVIIVDDASTDASSTVLQTWKEDSRFKIYFNEKNLGAGYTKSRCASLATGEICGYLDPDDVLTQDAIELMVRNHIANKNASLIYSDFYTCNKDLQHQNLVKNKTLPQSISYLEYAKSALGHFSTFKTEKYRQTAGLNPELKRAVDQDLFYKMEEVGDLLHIDGALYFYRLHKGGISVFENFNKAFSWHVYVAIEACKRRGIPFENVISKLVNFYYVDFYEESNAYKIGKLVLKPLKKIKSLFSNHISIRNKEG